MTSGRLAMLSSLAVLACAGMARADEFGGRIGIDVGGMGVGIKVDVNAPPERTHTRGQATVQASSKEEISSATPGEAFHLVYEDDPSTGCFFRVLEPEGLFLVVTDGPIPVHQNAIPTSFNCRPGTFYRFDVQAQGQVVFSKKFEGKRGKAATLRVVGSPPVNVQVAVAVPAEPRRERPHRDHEPKRGPSCMEARDVSAISAEIEDANFSDEKLGVLEDAMRHRTICGDEVVRLLDLFSFSNDKLKALEYMAPKIVDPENNFKIYSAFTFSSDKDKAKKILR